MRRIYRRTVSFYLCQIAQSSLIALGHSLYHLLISLHKVLITFWKRSLIISSLIGITHDFRQTIVARHNRETLSLTMRKDIITGSFLIRSLRFLSFVTKTERLRL